MEAVASSETLVNTSNITWHLNPEDKVKLPLCFSF